MYPHSTRYINTSYTAKLICLQNTRVRYAFDATVFIALLTHQFGNLPEQIRRWSEQIEYDEDNVAFLFNEYENNYLAK